MKNRELHHRKSHHQGVTLVELMVTLSILIVLLAIGVPSMKGFMDQQSVAARADAIDSAIKFSRSEALKRGQSVAMCISSTPDQASPTCDTSGSNWSTGWLIFVDANNNNLWDNNEQLLKVQQAIGKSGSLTANGSTRLIAFSADGFSIGSATTITASASNTTSTTSSNDRCVVLSLQGRSTTGKCS